MSLVFAALLGAALGSFANVLAIRWHEEVPLTGRSRCPSCKKTLAPRHLIPVLSWIFLRGRCANCRAPIHLHYPLVEAAAAALAVVAALRHDPFVEPAAFAFEAALSIALLVPVVMDIRWKELPVEWMLGIGAAAALRHLWQGDVTRVDLAVAIVASAAFFGVQYVLSRGAWIGAGDVWFGGMMGAVLGAPLPAALGIYLAYLTGGAVAITGLVIGVYRRGSRVPFAPALAAGTLMALWHGDRILAWLFPS